MTVRDATTRLHAAAAKALAAGLLSDEDVSDLRRLLRRGRPRPGAWHPDDAAIVAAFEARRLALAERLPARQPIDLLATTMTTTDQSTERGGEAAQSATSGAKRERKPTRKQRGGAKRTRTRRTPAPPRRAPALDELTDEQRLIVGKYRDLMTRLDGGTPPKEALEALGLTLKRSALRKLRRRYRECGVVGLYDWRWCREPQAQVPKAVRDLVEKWYIARPGAPLKAVWELVQEECGRQTLPLPSYQWVTWFVRNKMSNGVKLARNAGMVAWDKQAAPVGRYDPSTYANDIWQIDHNRTDIWVRTLTREGTVEPSEVWITVVMDVHSRAIMGFVVSTKVPNAWTTLRALRHAIAAKRNSDWPMHGIPRALTPDHAKEFKSLSVASGVKSLGITLDFCPAHYPNMKGEIERWFRTLQEGHLSKFKGYKKPRMKSAASARREVDTFLTPEQLEETIERWIVDVYHRRTHEGISNGPVDRSPLIAWEEDKRLRTSEPRELDVLLRMSDKLRVIGNRGIKLKLKRTPRMVFWAPELADRFRGQVRVRYNPDELAGVLCSTLLVYDADTGRRICVAHRMDVPGARYTNGDVTRERQRVRRAVVEQRRRCEREAAHDYLSGPQARTRARALATELATKLAAQPPRQTTDESAPPGKPLAAARAAPPLRAPEAQPARAVARQAKGTSPKPIDSTTSGPPVPTTPGVQTTGGDASAPATPPRGPAPRSSNHGAPRVLSLLELMERKDRGAA